MLGVLLSVLISLTAHADLVEPDTEYLVFHHRDVLGTAIATTDINGNVVHHTSTTPYGRDLGRRADDGQGFSDNAYPSSRSGEGYTGHVNDRQLELTYMRARFYDPVLGRFLSNDPVGFTSENPTSFNRYAYANNSPYRFVDPDGRDAKEAWAAAGVAPPGNPVAERAAQVGASFSSGADVVDGVVTDTATDPLTYAGAVGLGAKATSLLGRLGSVFRKGDVRGATIDQKRTGHIFRDSEGHLPDTPENRSLLERTASDPNRQLGTDRHGNVWSAETRADGTKVWTQTRDGKVINGGVNDSARQFNSETGLSATEKTNQ